MKFLFKQLIKKKKNKKIIIHKNVKEKNNKKKICKRFSEIVPME